LVRMRLVVVTAMLCVAPAGAWAGCERVGRIPDLEADRASVINSMKPFFAKPDQAYAVCMHFAAVTAAVERCGGVVAPVLAMSAAAGKAMHKNSCRKGTEAGRKDMSAAGDDLVCRVATLGYGPMGLMVACGWQD
jgi:hypothetical protein